MKIRNITLALAILCSLSVTAQEKDVPNMIETAKAYMRGGDFNNAILIYNRLLQSDPKNLELLKNLAYTYYLKKDLVSAYNTAEKMADRADADVQTYQIMGMIYKALENSKDAEKMYRLALKRYPRSGALHNEYGEMLWAKEKFKDAVAQWEEGIRMDPNYSGNYYNAAKYYYFSSDKVWGLLYGEIFINLESYSPRTNEVKKLLLDGYKKLFADADILKRQDTKNDFVKAYLATMQNHASDINTGITMENLHNLRMNFIREWDQALLAKYPYRLFDHQNQLLGMSLLEAYDYWIFGDLFKAGSFESWSNAHPNEKAEFLRLQQNRVFKIPDGQYYQTTGK